MAKIKFLRAVPGMAYFAGDVAEQPEAVAAKLQARGWAVYIPETEGPVNNLPEDLPSRELLFENGLETLDDVKMAIDAITDIKGIGKRTAAAIKKYIGQ